MRNQKAIIVHVNRTPSSLFSHRSTITRKKFFSSYYSLLSIPFTILLLLLFFTFSSWTAYNLDRRSINFPRNNFPMARHICSPTTSKKKRSSSQLVSTDTSVYDKSNHGLRTYYQRSISSNYTLA